MIPFGIIGTGRIATDYLTALADVPELRLRGVCDLRPEVARVVGERWNCAAYTELDALLEDRTLEAVLVAVPPSEHERISIACIERGLHVLCEKPFALDSESGERMFAAAEAAQRVLTMSAKFRHVPDVIEAKARLEAGRIGTAVFAENVFAAPVSMQDRWNSEPAISGGGVLIDNGTHSVDLLRYLFGPIRWIEAKQPAAIQSLPVEDSVRLVAGFDKELVASIDLSWSVSTHKSEYLSVHGSEGSLLLGWAESKQVPLGAAEALALGHGYRKIEALGRQLRHFARVIGEEASSLMDREDVMASIRVVEAAYASLRDDGVRIRLT